MKINILRLFSALMLVSMFLVGQSARPAYAAGYVVDSLADNNTAGDGSCTLREAIESANNAGNGDCGSNSSADDAITFNVNGTITLGSTLPSIVSGQGALTIDGSGQNITISGNNAVQVMIVDNGANLTLQNLTITQANTASGGGGVANSGTLIVRNSTFSNNTANGGGGISNFAGGTLTVINSFFSSNNATFGGSISNGGILTISNSTFANNTSTIAYGGGIHNNFGGTTTITDSLFLSNNATTGGGGISNSGTLNVINSTFTGNGANDGGGISSSGTLNVTNSTFTGNGANDGGGISGSGTINVTNSTFFTNVAGNNGGGISNSGTLNVTNSTLSGNGAGNSGGGIHIAGGSATLKNTLIANSTSGGDCVGTLSGTNNNNLIKNNASACGLMHGVNGNIIGQDPNLGTPTGSPTYFPLNPGSPAIDAGDNTTCAAAPVNNQSQNGVTRPQDGDGDSTAICDIGAYELTLQPASYIVNTTNDNATPGDSLCTLREAILAANNDFAYNSNSGCGAASSLNDTITFSVSGMITLGSMLPKIVSGQGTLTIDGSGQNIGISGNNTVRVMWVDSGADLTLRKLTITNGNIIGGDGAGVANFGALTVNRVSFLNGNAAAGGGIANFSGGTLLVSRSAFIGNNAVNGGGGIANYGGATLSVANTTFSSNSAAGSSGGGGIWNNGALTVNNSTFTANSANNGGGGIRIAGGSATLKNTLIANSTSGGDCVGTLSGTNNNNLIEDSGANACGLTNGANGNIIGSDPNLGALTSSPAYFPLNPGSPAIDAGDNATCAAAPVNNQSQNGVTRPQDGDDSDSIATCDIGSYEAVFPDLTATKSNNGGGIITLGSSFTWKVTVANTGANGATFAAGETILRDDLPSGATYGTPTVQNVDNVTGSITCTIAGNVLTCTANGGPVSFGVLSSAFDVVFSVTPTTTGALTNPASGGVCRADPNGVITESNEGNNDCTDTVTVSGVPDLTATKSNNVSGSITVGNSFTWKVKVANIGAASATFTSGQTILRDDLTGGATYGAPTVQNVVNVTGTITCAIASNVLTCTASGGPVTLAATTGAFDVAFSVTPTATGALTNPASGGICRADPNSVITESNESNNDCADTVTVNPYQVYLPLIVR